MFSNAKKILDIVNLPPILTGRIPKILYSFIK